MLLTQEVEVGVCGSEKILWNLGYKIPVVEHIYTKKMAILRLLERQPQEALK